MLQSPIHQFQQIRSLIVIILILGFAWEAGAQIRETTLGVERVIDTPGAFRCLKQYPDSGRGAASFLLWNKRSQDFYLAHVDPSFSCITTEHHSLRIPFDDILLADVNRDGKQELVFISQMERTISVVQDLSGDTLSIVHTCQLPFAPTGWIVGDINNDGITDLLVFDRNNPGIIPLIGDGTGNFIVRKSFAPDLAVGCLALTHLNNDNLIDIVAYDWVKSELHLLYGVGRGRFLDQSTFPVQGEVVEIIPTRLDPVSSLDLLLVQEHPDAIQDWQGNGIGDFHLAKQAVLGDTLLACALGDVNGDQWTDFGYLAKEPSLQILLNSGDEWSQDHIQFWAGKDPTALLLGDFNNDGRIDALVLDRAGKQLRFFFNSAQDNTLADSLEFASAPNPVGMVIHRIGTDNRNDLAIVNYLGRSLSLFANRGLGGLLGQTSFSISINPYFLSYHSSTDSSARFVTSSSSGDTLLLFSLNFKDSSSSYAIIPSEGSVQIVHTGINAQGQVEFLTFNTFSAVQNPDIHYYERLNPGTFIEQSFHLDKPDELLGATAEFLDSDHFPDLIYVYRNVDTGNVELSVSYGDSLMAYAQRHSSIELPRRDTASCYLWTGSFGHADTIDLLIYFGEPLNTLEQARGKGNGQFEQPSVVLQNVRLTNRSMLQIVDADNDGYADIVLNNAQEGALGWLKGMRDGTFEAWQPLIAIKPNEFFAVGDLNGDGIADIAVSRTSKGSIVIYNGIRRFSKGNHASGE